MFFENKHVVRTDKDYIQEKMKSQYYCPICGHTTTFVFRQEEKICKWCNYKIQKPKKSVYDINKIKFLKQRYKLFLKKKEGI